MVCKRKAALLVSSVEKNRVRQIEHPRCVNVMDDGSVATGTRRWGGGVGDDADDADDDALVHDEDDAYADVGGDDDDDVDEDGGDDDGDADYRRSDDDDADDYGDDDKEVHDGVDYVLLMMILMTMVLMLMMEHVVACEMWTLTVIVTMASTKCSAFMR